MKKFSKWLEEKDPELYEGVMDAIQGAADVAGMIPGIGAPIDAANAAVSLARGDMAGAALRGAAAIPGNVVPMGLLKTGAKAATGAAKAAGGAAKAGKAATMRSKQKKK